LLIIAAVVSVLGSTVSGRIIVIVIDIDIAATQGTKLISMLVGISPNVKYYVAKTCWQFGENLLPMKLLQRASNGQEKADQASTLRLIGVVHERSLLEMSTRHEV